MFGCFNKTRSTFVNIKGFGANFAVGFYEEFSGNFTNPANAMDIVPEVDRLPATPSLAKKFAYDFREFSGKRENCCDNLWSNTFEVILKNSNSPNF